MLQVTCRQYIRTASEQVAATLVPACYPAATTWGCPNGLQLCSSHESIPLGITPLSPNWVIIPIPHCESPNKGSMLRQNCINGRLTMHNPVHMSLIQGNAMKGKYQELTRSLGPVTWSALCMMSNTESNASTQKLYIIKRSRAGRICRPISVQIHHGKVDSCLHMHMCHTLSQQLTCIQMHMC